MTLESELRSRVATYVREFIEPSISDWEQKEEIPLDVVGKCGALGFYTIIAEALFDPTSKYSVTDGLCILDEFTRRSCCGGLCARLSS